MYAKKTNSVNKGCILHRFIVNNACKTKSQVNNISYKANSLENMNKNTILLFYIHTKQISTYNNANLYKYNIKFYKSQNIFTPSIKYVHLVILYS